jgi:hypothetical protein
MAITTKLNLRNGLTVDDAYVRVDAFYGSKRAITYTANIYLSREAFKGGVDQPALPYLEQEMFEFQPQSTADAAHVWEQCYSDLKSRERFADAIDA